MEQKEIWTYEQALEFLHERKTLGMRFQTSRVKDILKELGDPQQKCQFIHVAGTNGKGSTIAFLKNLFQVNGKQVATFTSPYLNSYLDHFMYQDMPIQEVDFIRILNKIRPIVRKMDQENEQKKATEFEILTILMFLYFSEKKPDIALIEVGLGGRYNATNVLTPEISVLTSIGIDHVAVLGDTLEEIAFQKAGIIKKQKPVIVGDIEEKPLEVIRNIAKEKESKVFGYAQEYGYYSLEKEDQSYCFTYKGFEMEISDIRLTMLGIHQVKNACVAITTYLLYAKNHKVPVSKEKIKKAIAMTSWAGRLETLSKRPFVLLDGAHNVDGMKALLDVIKQEFKTYKIQYLYAALENKDTKTMISMIDEVDTIDLIFTEFEREGVESAKNLAKKSKKERQIQLDYWSVIREFIAKNAPDELLLIGGSLYFISQIREPLLQHLKQDRNNPI